MSEEFIPVAGTNKNLETVVHNNSSGVQVHREAVYIGDPDAFESQARVFNQEPKRDAYGLVTRPILPTTAFGELPVAEPTPVVQVLATYGLSEKITQFTLNGGTITNGNRLFNAITSTDAESLSAPLSRRQVAYRAGQGVDARFTAIFDATPVADNVQQVGLMTATDRLGFGYSGTTFGIHYEHGGKTEIQELTVTTPAGGSEDATITVDGTAYTVPLTSGTVQHNALEIAESLNSQTDDFDFSSNDDQVVSRALLPGPKGSMAFSSSTAVASWSTVTTGVANTDDFIPQASWNIDTTAELDPTQGNVFRIKMQYLGFGAIFFDIEDPNTGIFETKHIIRYANANTLPSMSNPTFRLGIINENRGATTSTTVKTASLAGFIEGRSVPTIDPRSISNTVTSVATGSATNLISIRNRLVFGDLRNRAETQLLRLSARTDSTKGAIVEIRANATFGSDVTWQYIDKDNSITETATDGSPITGGRLIDSFVVGAEGVIIDLASLEETLLGGETLSITGETVSGTASDMTATLTIREDI